ncbi:hypothetical protein TFLX_01853 [Thermoflexales bacterium]|nr:hypothetical protein TFLX_01853 [Thermoflexales bacterium]
MTRVITNTERRMNQTANPSQRPPIGFVTGREWTLKQSLDQPFQRPRGES